MRSALAALLVVLGGLLVAAAVPAAWAHSMITDTNRFVDATRSLADDPGVQDAVAGVVAPAVSEQLRQSGLVASSLPPALRRLGPSVEQAVQVLVRRTVEGYVRGPGFRDLWPTMVRTGHESLVATLTVGSARTVTVDATPVVAQVQSQLAAAGLPLRGGAAPSPSVRLEVSPGGTLASLREPVGLLDPASVLLPVGGGLVLLLGLAVARRRLPALAGAAVAVAAGLGLVFLAVRLARPRAVASFAPDVLPESSRRAVYDAVTADLSLWLVYALVGCGVVVALVVVLLAVGRARRIASY